MKFSEKWLREWANPNINSNELIEKLTLSGLEVDGTEPAAPDFSGLFVAEIISCSSHPDADKLQVCEVSNGQETLQIVCGAPNARAGLLAPLAVVGAIMPGNFKIKKAKLRGVESFGMLCSAKELGLSEDHTGLMELPSDAPIGEDLRIWLGLDDQIIDVDLTPNRADCLSIRGLAQEVSALTDCELTVPEFAEVAIESDATFSVRLKSPEDCPKYLGRVIEGLDLAQTTPIWMQEKLRRGGIRSISPAVDVTNYVMLELGQPLHAFDRDVLAGDEIIVRRADDGETLTLLDGKTIELHAKNLLICDESGPLALAGIMGGENSGVSEQTHRVFLECAWFNPVSIMGKARDLGLHTDSSHRYERGVDHHLQKMAIERATQLLIEIAGGQAGPLTIAEAQTFLPQTQTVSLRKSRLKRVLGAEVPDDVVTQILTKLGMNPVVSAEAWTIQSPSHRVDIEIEEDLIEEIARVYGYNQLPTLSPGGRLSLDPVSERRLSERRVRTAMVDLGYQEAINYSFVGADQLDAMGMKKDRIELANPLSEDLSTMRTSLIPGLMASLVSNSKHQQARIRLFETGACFEKAAAEVNQSKHLAAVITGQVYPELWANEKRALDFYDLKGDVEHILNLSGMTWQVASNQSDLPWLHPGKCAEILVEEQIIGWLGAVHPDYQKKTGCKSEVYAFELDFDQMLNAKIPAFQEITKFPSIRRDLALMVPKQINVSQIQGLIIESVGDLLQEIVIFDQYSGDNIEKGFKSLAIGLILQEESRTLKDEDAEQVINQVIENLQKTLNIQLRG